MECYILYLYLIAINTAAFSAMAIDKHRARRHRWRIRERTLLTLALLGGSIGAIAAMRLLRHKTNHPRFSVGLPIMFVAEYGALILGYILLTL